MQIFSTWQSSGQEWFFSSGSSFLEESSAGALEMQATTVMYSIMYKSRARLVKIDKNTR